MIARYSAEHDAIINAMGELRRLAANDDREAAGIAVSSLLDLLAPHVASEERSLFAELHNDAEFTDHVDGLCSEHRDIDARIASVVLGDLTDMDGLEKLLRRHIDKEENGLFPAAAIALGGPAWQRVVDFA
ncbi:MAG: hemerythrin domain-containing protein [Candidatus Nanopelagicales bacterium]